MNPVRHLSDCYSEGLWTHCSSRLLQEDDAKDLVNYWCTRQEEIERNAVSSQDGLPIPSHKQGKVTYEEELRECTALKLQAGKMECAAVRKSHAFTDHSPPDPEP